MARTRLIAKGTKAAKTRPASPRTPAAGSVPTTQLVGTSWRARGTRQPAAQMAAALDAFWELARRLNLSTIEQAKMLAVSESTRGRWAAGKLPIPAKDLLSRLRFLLLVYQHLLELAGTDEAATVLLRSPGSADNSAAAHESVLDAVTTESLLDLERVEQVLHSRVLG